MKKLITNTEEYLEHRGIAQQDPFYPDALISIYRVGSHIVLPGIDPDQIEAQCKVQGVVSLV